MKTLFTLFFFLFITQSFAQSQQPDSLKTKITLTGNIGAITTEEQKQDSAKNNIVIRGSIGITNNGFSFIPAFTLDRPAALGVVAVEKKKLSFESQLRYALDGQPWSFVLISRYKLITTHKVQASVGLQYPSISFTRLSILQDNTQREVLQSYQSAASELNVDLQLSKRVSVGLSHLYNRGLAGTLPLNGNFVGIRAGLSDIHLSTSLRLGIYPQVFYLKLDQTDGFYTAGSVILSKKKSPITLSSMMYKTLRSTIGGKGFNWNVSLTYTFGNKYWKG